MTRNEQLQLIRQKCIEACEDMSGSKNRLLGGDRATLANVLLAIEKQGDEHHLTNEGQFALYDPEDGRMHLSKVWWNLRNDDLTEQSDSTIEFFYNLLK